MKIERTLLASNEGTLVSTKHTRRRFIRNFVVGTAVSTIIGEGWLGTLLADCQPTRPGDGILKITIADFPALQAENGSVRLTFNPFTITGPTGAFYPVLINRGPNNRFFTLSTQFQHLFCVVPPYDATVGASTCPCHESKYAIDGAVLLGLTVKPLIPYPNSFDGSSLCVEIPNLGFSVTGTAVQSGAGPRFQLQFVTKSSVKYQVVFRQSSGDIGTVIPFATTSGGIANATALTGNGFVATVFVDRTSDSGFYSISVPVTEG